MMRPVTARSIDSDATDPPDASGQAMQRELFGVFGGIETFERLRDTDEFTQVLGNRHLTVGIRDRNIGTPHWSSAYDSDDGICVIFGELYTPDEQHSPAEWVFDRYQTHGRRALSELNGSYLLAIGTPEDEIVACDPIRSKECFYTDALGERVFGSDSAAVGAIIPEPNLRKAAFLEYLHLGVTLGTKTSLTQLHRLPMDSLLTGSTVDTLDRFIYNQQEFDFATELGNRLRRALDRRSRLPGSKGLLLSAGYDSRTFLPAIPEISQCYTVGDPSRQEVVGARRLAGQFGTTHTTFEPDRRYLLADEQKVRYSQGIKESLHIHHAGYADEIDVDTVYHGLLCDTFFRGHFTAEQELEIFGRRIPLNRPDPDPEPVDSLLDRFGYNSNQSAVLEEHTSISCDPPAFVRRAVSAEFERVGERADCEQNALNACGIGNQPSMPFHTQLSDNYLGSFLATDIELIDWHLSTPPAHRTTRTFLDACLSIDADLTRHRPPDRPHLSPLANEAERFLRQHVPGLESFEPPWPDRNAMFERYELDSILIPELEHLHDPLSARHKLRVHDVLGWLEQAAPGVAKDARTSLGA